MRLRPKRYTIYNTDGSKYLERWSLFDIRGVSFKFHVFHSSDDERDLHDHPWSFVSIILRGGYRELTPLMGQPRIAVEKTTMLGLARETVWRWYGPGSVLWRPAPWLHRVDIQPGTGGKVWTLVLTLGKRREWGFHTVCGWIPWFKYAAVKATGEC